VVPRRSWADADIWGLDTVKFIRESFEHVSFHAERNVCSSGACRWRTGVHHEHVPVRRENTEVNHLGCDDADARGLCRLIFAPVERSKRGLRAFSRDIVTPRTAAERVC